MTQDEIRKLLGGYATNALTKDERRILFEAALDDQELFNALQNEDALRELLEDPVTRGLVRSALGRRRPGFWSRRWIYGVVMPAVAAVIVIILMNRTNVPHQIAPSPAPAPPQVVAREVAPKIEPVPTPVKKQTIAPKASPAVPAPPRLQLETARGVAGTNLVAPVAAPVMAALRAPAPPPIPSAVRQAFSSIDVTTASPYQGPLVQYSLVRTDQAVRVQVTTGIGGYLALYQIEPSENWKRVYPAGNNDVAARVLPNLPIQIPNEPLHPADSGARLKLVFVPTPPGAINGLVGGAAGGLVNNGLVNNGVLPIQVPLTPLVVDIPLAPN